MGLLEKAAISAAAAFISIYKMKQRANWGQGKANILVIQGEH